MYISDIPTMFDLLLKNSLDVYSLSKFSTRNHVYIIQNTHICKICFSENSKIELKIEVIILIFYSYKLQLFKTINLSKRIR